MDNVIVYVGPGFSPDESQKIMNILRMRSVMVTTDQACATIVILPGEQNLDEIFDQIQEFTIPPRLVDMFPQDIDIIVPKPKQKPKTFTRNYPVKQFDKTKQNYRQRFLTRTRCK